MTPACSFKVASSSGRFLEDLEDAPTLGLYYRLEDLSCPAKGAILVRSIFLVLLTGCLAISIAGCAGSTEQVQDAATARAAPPALPTPTALAAGARQVPEAFVVGDARFTRTELKIESSQSVAVAAADFDGDRNLDLVISGEPMLTILRGDGQGGMVESDRIPGGEQPVDFAIADLNEDGHLDIIVANHDTDYLTILFGDGQGNFKAAPGSPLRIAVSPHPHAVLAVDLNMDGHIDLVVDHRDAHALLVLPGLGDGSFESTGFLLEVGGDPYRGMASGDLDRDGRIDLVTPNPGDTGVFLNATNVQLAFEPGLRVDSEDPFAVDIGDFNGDGVLDLIAASDESYQVVEIFHGTGDGRFDELNSIEFQFAIGAKSIAVGDFNGDGFNDAAIAAWQSPEVMMILGGSDRLATGLLPGGEHPWGLVAADINRDGKDDLVIVDDASALVSMYLSAGAE